MKLFAAAMKCLLSLENSDFLIVHDTTLILESFIRVKQGTGRSLLH